MCGIHTLARHLSCFMEHAANRRLFRSEASGDTLASSGDTRFSACAFRNFRGDKPPEAAPDGASPSEQRSSCGRECSRGGCCRASSSRLRHRLPPSFGDVQLIILNKVSRRRQHAGWATASQWWLYSTTASRSATCPRRRPLAAARPSLPSPPPLAAVRPRCRLALAAAASLSPPPPRSHRHHIPTC